MNFTSIFLRKDKLNIVSDKQKLREFVSNRTSQGVILREILQAKMKGY